MATGFPIGELDPYSSKAGMGANLVELVYPTLFRVRADPDIFPELAEKLEFQNGQRDIMLTLRSDSAEAVRASVLKAKQSPGGHFQEGLKNLDSIQVLSPRQLVLHLKTFDRAVLYELSLLPIQPEDATHTALGTFALSSLSGEELTLNRIQADPAKVNRIIVKSIPSPRRAIRELVAGNIDLLLFGDQADFQFLSDLGELKVDELATSLLYALLENRQRSRDQASLDWNGINEKLDKADWLKVLHSQELAPVSWPIPGEPAPEAIGSSSSPESSQSPAKQDGGARTLSFLGYQSRDRQLARLIKRRFEDLGITLDLRSLTPQEFEKEVFEKKDFDLVLFPINIKSPLMTHYLVFHSPEGSNSLNVWGYRNPEFDRLIEKARYEENSLAAAKALHQAIQSLMRDPPGLFLFWVKTPIVYRKACSGFNLKGNEFFSSLKDVRCEP